MSDVVASAVVAGSVGLAAAILSFIVALATMRGARRDSERAQHLQYALSLVPRRLDAFERAWNLLFTLEARGQLTDNEIEAIVGTTLWMPPILRDELLHLLSRDSTPPGEILRVRAILIAASGAHEIDEVATRFRPHDDNSRNLE